MNQELEHDGEKGVVIAGGGPAGLAAAYELARSGHAPTLLEATCELGGISRTVERDGYLFDLGGHRFFTKNKEVEALWREVLSEQFLRRPRLSRIYYRGRFFGYPIGFMDTLRGLGVVESFRVGCSYFWRKLFPHRPEHDFESWVSNQFGDRLYQHFFKSYTEKVWGISCSRIASEWGAQRIKGLSLLTAVRSALFPPKHGEIKTLVQEFDYPGLGCGQMYAEMGAKAEAMGAGILREHRVDLIEHDGERVVAVTAEFPKGLRRFETEAFISTMPLTELVLRMKPELPEEAREAASALTYRSLMVVALLIDQEETVPDTWIYVHEPSVRMGRIQCFKNWSPAMVPDPSKSSLGCEYFATEGDELWNTDDRSLIAMAKAELKHIGIPGSERVTGGFVVRVPKSYPVFDLDYAPRVRAIRKALAPFGNLHVAGRNGMFRYNNMDHSVFTGLLAARNALGASHDIWEVNTDAEYHEEAEEAGSDPEGGT